MLGSRFVDDVGKSYKNACHPERSEGSLRPASQILRFAQDDSQDTSQVRSREALSPIVWWYITNIESVDTLFSDGGIYAVWFCFSKW